MARCALCNDLCKRHVSHLELSFDFTLKEIAHSTLWNRCESCVVICEGIRQAQSKDWHLLAPLVKRVFARCLGEHGGHTDTLHLVVVFNEEAEIPPLRLEFYSLEPQAWKAILPRSIISSNPLSDHALTWARARLDICNQSHVSCKSSRPKQLPKRLLSLKRDSKGDIDVKLVEIMSDFCDAYAALSHCWGNEQRLLATAKTLQSHKKSILWLHIPDTFKDAIRLAMRLNIGFIWIDSLCILQDNQKDWEVESSKMADIYQHAILTLAATTSSASSQGTYSRNPRIAKHTEIILQGGVAGYRIGVRERVRHWNRKTANDEKQFPLLSRGWVLQERLLSPRILHLSGTELIWECREVTACECGTLDQDSSPGAVFYNLIKGFDEQQIGLEHSTAMKRLPILWSRIKAKSPSSKFRNSWFGPVSSPQSTASSTTTTTRPVTINIESYQQPPSVEFKEENNPDFVSYYHRLVEQYSALNLTRPTDRLPAFSGISERMQHFRHDYLAGLWSDSLCFDLMWRIDVHVLWMVRSPRPEEYCGPSWSWVSAIAPVQYWSDITNYRDTVPRFLRELASDRVNITTPLLLNRTKLEYNVRVPGKNPYGSVESGVLTLEASAVPATLQNPFYYLSTGALRPDHDRMDWIDQYRVHYRVEIEHGDAHDANIYVNIFADYHFSQPGPAEICEGTEVMLLLVHPDVALVLRRKSRAGEYTYIEGEPAWERIGIARVSDELSGHGTIDWMMYSQVQTFRIV
ncbi:HET-domain-containing protein [Cucurbitaria berberidis CBS 394.84]|uniref:HET-domain-containing protein n=1 Tax=Cucurbitaria berberidis CBS 394.84 TaxID=1168544 RepID=A0A9P4GMK8_9PLEO|nr:HET-domain-containing protein [Cucurbitaria berberidis CBS 394.84]KAF1847959.1 HET-domain-containing protein [Cucurbitaria berberidis CBS 394.84]